MSSPEPTPPTVQPGTTGPAVTGPADIDSTTGAAGTDSSVTGAAQPDSTTGSAPTNRAQTGSTSASSATGATKTGQTKTDAAKTDAAKRADRSGPITIRRSPRRPKASPLIKVAMIAFALGVIAILADMALFASGSRDLPLWLNLCALLAPIGFGLGLVGVFLENRHSARAVTARQHETITS